MPKTTKEPKSFHCENCEVSYTTKYRLKKHVEKKHKENPLQENVQPTLPEGALLKNSIMKQDSNLQVPKVSGIMPNIPQNNSPKQSKPLQEIASNQDPFIGCAKNQYFE